MRRAALLIAFALLAAACSGSDDAASTTTGERPGDDGETTTTQASEGGANGIADSGELVSVDYVGTLSNGTEFDTSIGKEPLQFTVDAGQMIQGFNDAVVGMAVGETKTVTLPPEQAYQDYNEDLIIDVELSQLPEGVQPGDELISPVGQVVTVLEVGDEFATLDTNHPLAGESLIFEITLVSIDSEG